MAKIKDDCNALAAELSVTCQFRQPTPKVKDVTGNLWKFEATGHDRPGIVSRLSTAMASQGVSVNSMDTAVINMAFIGTPMFNVRGSLSIPDDIDANSLRDTLEELCEDMALVLEFTRQV